MKLIDYVMVVVVGLAFSVSTFAEESMPMTDAAADIPYISGGVGQSESEMLRGVAKDYALEVVLVQKSKQREVFLANVRVQVQDANKNIVLDTVAKGPYLFANLPQGKYLVVAELAGVEKRRWVNIQAKKHQRIVLLWPAPEDEAMDAFTE